MKLELKHLANYLPYGLKIKFDKNKIVKELSPGLLSNIYGNGQILQFKAILRPLSDFDKIGNDFGLSTDFESSYFSGLNEVAFINTSDRTYLSDMLTATDFLFENHFDVFDLIEKGLAIDINTLEL